MKAFLLVFLFASFGLLNATPSGKGFDVIYPVPVADPDIYHDDGAFQTSLAVSMLGDRSTKTLDLSYALAKPSARSLLSVNFLWFDYSFSKNSLDVEGGEIQLGLNYNKILIQHRKKVNKFEVQMRPSIFNLSWFSGLAIGTANIDAEVTDPSGQTNFKDPITELRSSDTPRSGKATMFPINAGLIADWSFSKRHGVQAYGHASYDLDAVSDVFTSTQSFVLNAGFNYYYRRAARFLPFEWTGGVIFTPSVNDIDSTMGVSLNIGFRKHW